RSAMSQRTSTRPGEAVICRYESLALCANAAAAPSSRRAPTMARSAARQPPARSEDGIDPPIVEPERLALARDVTARERQRALGVAIDRQREHRLLAPVEDARLGTLVGERD